MPAERSPQLKHQRPKQLIQECIEHADAIDRILNTGGFYDRSVRRRIRNIIAKAAEAEGVDVALLRKELR